jgi:hypothetical protein
MTMEAGEWKPTVDQLKQLIANHRAMKRDPEAEDTLELAVFQWAVKAIDLMRKNEKELRAMAKDADRYRYLKEHHHYHHSMTQYSPMECGIAYEFQQSRPGESALSLDEIIDRDMGLTKQQDKEDAA